MFSPSIRRTAAAAAAAVAAAAAAATRSQPEAADEALRKVGGHERKLIFV